MTGHLLFWHDDYLLRQVLERVTLAYDAEEIAISRVSCGSYALTLVDAEDYTPARQAMIGRYAAQQFAEIYKEEN